MVDYNPYSAEGKKNIAKTEESRRQKVQAKISAGRAAGKPKPKSKDEIAAAVKPKKATAMRSYRASRGDSLYSIAEKTLPKGKDLSSWFGAIKKMNAGKKLYANTGVALPPGSSLWKQGMPYPSSSLKPVPGNKNAPKKFQ
jgi:Tfp pilus assembly protein FimV